MIWRNNNFKYLSKINFLFDQLSLVHLTSPIAIWSFLRDNSALNQFNLVKQSSKNWQSLLATMHQTLPLDGKEKCLVLHFTTLILPILSKNTVIHYHYRLVWVQLSIFKMSRRSFLVNRSPLVSIQLPSIATLNG